MKETNYDIEDLYITEGVSKLLERHRIMYFADRQDEMIYPIKERVGIHLYLRQFIGGRRNRHNRLCDVL
jgi:hypothetical protein